MLEEEAEAAEVLGLLEVVHQEVVLVMVQQEVMAEVEVEAAVRARM